ncbi:MAG TPA: right-handed parallel beta-helix repeat-containing protein, partial [Candidatus Saccharimonadales bacterium]|nr:right-handed parallel beta-helix repeat-containing protein [Candidatus Saccharimonadales bacterium]
MKKRFAKNWNRAVVTSRKAMIAAVLIPAFVLSGLANITLQPHAKAAMTVPGQSYQICGANAAQYLTSPWTYHALASGSQTYTVSQYQALTGYGTTLPPLPSYISAQGASATAAIIFAPGATTTGPAYNYPNTPLLYFFEGGAYGALGFDTVSGDQFIGGSTSGFPEPTFDNGGNANGINGQNGSNYFSGGASTLASGASAGATSVTTTTAIPGYINWVTFSDGSTYHIDSASGTTLTLGSALSSGKSAGSSVWANQSQPIGKVASSAAQGAATVSITNATVPFVQWQNFYIGDHVYRASSVSGTEASGYTVNVGTGGLDLPAAANMPVYFSDNSGSVTVSYLDIAHDEHITTGTIYTGAGWTISHNNIHDGYSHGPGFGVAVYGGEEGVVEYNCFSKMGDYAINVFGHNNKFRYNEVFDTNYLPDPGCGCSGGGKWWGTLNADITDNAFINNSHGDSLVIWLDNGNAGTLISGNYFDKSSSSSIHSETGFNLDIENNLFLDSGWGTGNGCGGDSNCIGQVNLNSSGGFDVPGSRYNNQIIVSGNQFINNWGGIDIWQSGGRSCENSGEGWPEDADYCSGGFPITMESTAGGQYYYSHRGTSTNQ